MKLDSAISSTISLLQGTLLTVDEKKLDRTAQKLLAIFEDDVKHLSPAEKDAKWRAFSREVAITDIHAKPQARPKTAENPRVSRRRA
jgi:hypothetical protein